MSSALLFGFCFSLGLIVLGVVGPERWWPFFDTLIAPGYFLKTHTVLDAVAALLFNGLFYAAVYFVIGAAVKRARGR